jgi:hypothetical protein
MKNGRSREALGTLAFNGGTQDIVRGKSLTKNLPKDHKHFFEGCKPLDVLKDDLAIQAFTLEHLLSVWTGARLDHGVVDEPAHFLASSREHRMIRIKTLCLI